MIKNFDKEHLYFMGDIHGKYNSIKTWIKDVNIENSLIIQVGDFGVGFKNFMFDYYDLTLLNEFLKENNNVLLAFRGNHDDKKYFNEIAFNLSNLVLIKDYSVITIKGVNILCVGGAISIDRIFRKTNLSYFKNEGFVFSKKEIEKLYKENITFDIVCTHTSPDFTFPRDMNNIKYFLDKDKTLEKELINERRRMTKLFNCIYDNYNTPEYWFYGHFHNNVTETHKNICFKLLDMYREDSDYNRWVYKYEFNETK